jgi:hypothetical protein
MIMTAYTLRQANSWFSIETLLNIGIIFGIYSGDDRPLSPGNSTEELKTASQETLTPSTPSKKKKSVDTQSEPTTTPTMETDSEV